jgi:ribosomal protein S6
MLVETSSIECAREGYYKIFEFKVFNNVVKGLNAIVIIANKLLNLI